MILEESELLTGLVSIPSPSGEEKEASQYLSHWMSQKGGNAFVDEAGNAVGQFGSGEKELLLLGHIDTFPGWIPVRQKDGHLWGRGTVDAKGPLCAFACAAASLEIPADWRITVVGAVEEESATSKGARHIVRERILKAQIPRACIIGEPSQWDRITIGYKGRLLLNLEVFSALAHSSGPTPLPAENLVLIWNTIQQVCFAWNEKEGGQNSFDKIQPSLRSVQSREEGCYGAASLSSGFRLPSKMPPEAMKALLLTSLSPWQPELIDMLAIRHGKGAQEDFCCDQTPRLQLAFAGEEVCWKGSKSNFLVQAFLAALRENFAEPRFVVKTGTSDLNILGPAFPEMPILAYGPGNSALDHTPQEAIDLAEYGRSIQVLRGTLRRILSSSP